MKIGPLEIIVIIIAAFAAGLMFRLFRGDRSLDDGHTNNSVAVSTGQEVAKGSNNRVRKAGIVLVVLGAILVMMGMSTFEFVMKMFFWGFVLAGVGLLALYLSRNRQ